MDRTCQKCGHTVKKEDVYCINCGALLDKKEPENQRKQEWDNPPKGGPYAPLSLGDYMFIGLILMIPIVNLIVLFVWVLDKNSNVNRRNLAKAGLIYLGIATALAVIFSVGIVRAVILDEQTYQKQKNYEFHIEHPEFDDWMQLET